MGEVTVLGGALKRQRVPTLLKSPGLRPILAQIKKSLFDILKHSIDGSSFLDLFAGTGAVGFEALSRGARRVVFIEQDPLYFKRLNESLRIFSGHNADFFIGKEIKVYKADVIKGLGWIESDFDIIFSGAPYVDKDKKPLSFVGQLLLLLKRDSLLKEGGIFIAQHYKKEVFDLPAFWKLTRQEKYGDTVLSFFKSL